MTRASRAIDRALPFAAIGVGIAFAILSWVVVDEWAFPTLVARRGAMIADDPQVVLSRPEEVAFGASVLAVALWPLTIALAHVLAGALLVVLRRAPLRVRLAILVASVAVVWLVAGDAVGPPDIASRLTFSGAALAVLAILWLVALAIGSAVRR